MEIKIVMSTTANKKLPHKAILKAPGLLPMLYKLGEAADELDLAEYTLRSWFAHGAPHERDARGHYWINGELLAKWIAGQSKPKKRRHLNDGEAYCMRCKSVVQLENPQILPGKGKQFFIRGVCQVCGAVLNRGGRVGKSR